MRIARKGCSRTREMVLTPDKGIDTSKRLGRHRWIVEACLARLRTTATWSAATDAKPSTSKNSPTSGCLPICYRRWVNAAN
jgi:hypothetical protein